MGVTEIIEELPKLSATERSQIWEKLEQISEADVPESFRKGMKDIADGRMWTWNRL